MLAPSHPAVVADSLTPSQHHWSSIVADSLFLGNDDTVVLLPAFAAVAYGIAFLFQLFIAGVVHVLAWLLQAVRLPHGRSVLR